MAGLDSRQGVGFEDAAQRSLFRQMLWVTGVTLSGFSVLQFLSGHALFASLELIASVLLVWAAWRVGRARHLTLWMFLYLLPTCSFLLYIIVMPDASPTAFVWVYSIPPLIYLLLGKRLGFILTIPFMLAATWCYLARYAIPTNAAGWIDLGNALLCGVLVIIFVHLYESRRAKAHEELARLAQTDALTGVANRGCFEQALKRSIQEAQRSHTQLTLVVLDVDHFKSVNDRWGHEAGDTVLRHVCVTLQQRLRGTDLLGRLGGEEFGLLLRDIEPAQAEPLVQQLRAQIAALHVEYAGQTIVVSATFGLAQWPIDGSTADELYRCADKRMYQGKMQGRNQLVSSDADVVLNISSLI